MDCRGIKFAGFALFQDDIKALRKYLANKFSLRGLVPYHADGGVGMKVSYEIV